MEDEHIFKYKGLKRGAPIVANGSKDIWSADALDLSSNG